MPDLIPDQPTHLFVIPTPLGYKTTAVCGVGHPLAFQHEMTGSSYIPLTINGQIACTLCMAVTVGMTCARSHKSFEVAD